MITDALLGVFLYPLRLAVGALPAGEPLNLQGNALLIGFGQFNTFLPLTEAVAAFALVLAVEFAVVQFRVFVTLWRLLPFT